MYSHMFNPYAPFGTYAPAVVPAVPVAPTMMPVTPVPPAVTPVVPVPPVLAAPVPPLASVSPVVATPVVPALMAVPPPSPGYSPYSGCMCPACTAMRAQELDICTCPECVAEVERRLSIVPDQGGALEDVTALYELDEAMARSVIIVRLSPEEKEYIADFATACERSISDVARTAILEYIEDQYDAHAESEDEPSFDHMDGRES